MSPGGPVAGVVVAHGDVAAALVRAVERISGIRGALAPVSNAECSPEELVRRVRESVGPGPAVVFVDMASGSCAHASRRAGRLGTGLAVVSGVNLPMLLDFVFHRDMELRELAERLVHKGRSATTLAVFPRGGPPADGSGTVEPDPAGRDRDAGT